jgi:hypothetical protein
MQDGAVLTSIQVPPLPFRLMVVQWAGCGALGTGPTGEVFMGQIDMYFFGCQLQVHGGHAPGAFDAKDAPVKFSIFHP